MLEGIGGAIGGLIGQATAGKGGAGKLKQISKLWKDLTTPGFDYRDLTAPELQMAAEFFPETYEAVVPEDVRMAVAGPEGREAQLTAITGLDEIARGGMPLADRLATQEATFRLSDANNRTNRGIMANMAARGRTGGGAEVAGRLGAGQTGANLAAQLGRGIVQESMARRPGALQALAGAGGAMRSADMDEAAENARAVNRFNEVTAQIRNQAARDASSARSQAQAYNVGTRQRLADSNVMNRYQNESENLNRGNDLLQQDFGNRVTKLQGYSGALMNEGAMKEAKRSERIRTAQGIGSGIGSAAGSALSFGLGGAGGGLGGLLGGGGGGAAAAQSGGTPGIHNDQFGYWDLR